MAALTDLREEQTAALAELDTLVESDDYDPDDDQIVKMRAAIDRRAKQIGALEQNAKLRDGLAATGAGTLTRDRPGLDTGDGLSAGEVFVRSAPFKAYQGYGASGRVTVGDTLTRALPMTTTTFAKAVQAGARYVPDPTLATPLLDLIPTVVTSLGSFPVWGMKAADGTDTTDSGATKVAEGADKPSIEFVETAIDVALETIAVWTQVTRQALDDIPMLRTIIDNALRRNVLHAFEAEAIAAIVAGVTATAAAPSGGTMQGAIRLGIAKVQTAGWQPNAVAVAPDDAANVDIAALENACCSADNFWSLRVVPVPGMTAGTAIVGDFTNGATTYARSAGVDVFITDSHADTFIKNVFTILAETRRKTVVERADAFAKVSVTP